MIKKIDKNAVRVRKHARVLKKLKGGTAETPRLCVYRSNKNIEAQVNKCDITAYYLEARHPNHYMIFNLAEETYDTFLFHDQV